MKKVLLVQRSETPHWVGDGFPVRTLFSYNDIAKLISPFLLMDYAGPTVFPPTDRRLGVGSHPHRGFETVTLVYEGQVEHRDSAGGGGVIQSGDVQWMTAASGLVHEEKHGKDFARSGGNFEMVQLWVNLPKKDKMSKPRYQGIMSSQIPVVTFPENTGTLRVISGVYKGAEGPAKTHTPINMWDMRLNENTQVELVVPSGHTAVLFVLDGEVEVSGTHTLKNAELAVLENEGNTVSLRVKKESKILFLGGEPLNEPIVGYGPFVMNTQAEIMQAFKDFEAGKMGEIESIDGSEI